jgi:hypothetical protein
MSKSHVHEFRGTDNQPTSHTKSDPQTRHSKADALGDTEFESLVETTYDMEDYYGLQARFILFVCGRLGLRVGELAHLTEDWIDERRSMICIPRHDQCTNGRDGGLCGQCRQAVRQMARIRSDNRYTEAHDQLGERDQYEPGGGQAVGAVVDESALADRMWAPKTEAAAREVAFDSVTRAETAPPTPTFWSVAVEGTSIRRHLPGRDRGQHRRHHSRWRSHATGGRHSRRARRRARPSTRSRRHRPHRH